MPHTPCRDLHLSDLKYWETVAAGVYSITGIPDNILIDPEGIIVARGLRGDSLEAKLAEIFKQGAKFDSSAISLRQDRQGESRGNAKK